MAGAHSRRGRARPGPGLLGALGPGGPGRGALAPGPGRGRARDSRVGASAARSWRAVCAWLDEGSRRAWLETDKAAQRPLLRRSGLRGRRQGHGPRRRHVVHATGPPTVKPAVRVHLVDGTYELFRHFYGAPPRASSEGGEVGAVRGVVQSVLSMLAAEATHVGVATDHVIESFRNDLWPGYKTGEGVDPVLMAQFPLLEAALVAMGVVVWPMVELEADDALASAAAVASDDDGVDAGPHLHPGQGPGPVRPGHARGAARPAQGRHHRRGGGAGPLRHRARCRSPTGSPSWATAPTGSPASRAGASSRRRRCSDATSTSRPSPPSASDWDPGAAKLRCAAPPSWPIDWRRRWTTRCCFATWPPCASTAPCWTSVDDLAWTGPHRRLRGHRPLPPRPRPGRPRRRTGLGSLRGRSATRRAARYRAVMSAPTTDGNRPSGSRTGSCGEPPPPPTRSRAATSTTTGGSGSTTPRRDASRRVATPATRSTAGTRTSTSWPDLGLGAYRFSLEWSRIEPAEGEFSRGRPRPLPAHVRGLSRARRLAGGHLPPLHDPALAGRPRRLGGPRRAGALRPLRGAHRGPHRRPHRLGLHHQRAQRGGRARLHRRHLPAGHEGRIRPAFRRQRRDGPGASPGRRRPALGAGIVPRRDHACRWRSSWRARVAKGTRDAAEQILENTFLDGTAGDDFIGVQCYERTVLGPTGPDRAAAGNAPDPDGLRVLAPGGRVHRAPGRRLHRAPRARDRERARHRGRPRAHRVHHHRARRACTAASPTGSTCAATSCGACSTTSSGTSDSAPSSGICAVDPVTFDRRPKPSAHWFGTWPGERPAEGSGALGIALHAREGRPGRSRRRRR